MKAETLGISAGFLHSIQEEKLALSKLHVHVGYQKRCAQIRRGKTHKAYCSVEFLSKLDADPNDFMTIVVTEDDNWIYIYDPETKSKQWLPACSS